MMDVIKKEELEFNDIDNIIEDIKTHESVREKEIYYLKTKEKYSIIKKLVKHIGKEREELRFFISSSNQIKGKVVNRYYRFMRKMPLVTLCERWIKTNKFMPAERVLEAFTLDERPERWWKKVDELYVGFFMYDFICGNKQFILLSEKELQTEEYTVTGMVVDISNLNNVTKDCKITQRIPLLFINKIEPNKILFKDKADLISYVKEMKMTKDGFFNFLFLLKEISYRQPRWYENLIGAFLFSADYDDYRNYLMVIGEPETGKTRHMLAIYDKFDEPQAHTSGSNSTIRGLIPSFNSNPIKMGALIQSIRFHAIDEFLRILNDKDDDSKKMTLGKLNSLYDGINELFESGNGSAEGQMKCKVMCVSNPSYGCSNIEMMCNWLDTAFLSRNIIYFQNKEHTEQIKSNQLLEKPLFKMKKSEFKAIYDFFMTFRSSYSHDMIKYIYDKYKEKLKPQYETEQTHSHYKSRQLHHLHCIADGYIKLRCLTEQDEKFEAIEEDYLKIDEIWYNIIKSWLPNRDFDRITNQEIKQIVGGEGYI